MAKKVIKKKSEGTPEGETVKKKKARKFKAGQTYQFRGNGVAPSLLKGMVYKVSSLQAELFTKNGYGQVID